MKELAEREPADKPEPEVLDMSKYSLLSPALDFGPNIGLTTIATLALVDRRPVNMPYIVTSDRLVLPINQAGLVDLGEQTVIFKDAPAAAGMTKGWSWADAQRFAKGDTPSPIETYLNVVEVFEKYMEFQEPHTAEVLSLWLMGTYLYPVFAAFPFLALSGPAGSGKTKTGDLVTYLAFNARSSANISPAALYRVVQYTGASLFIDGAERLSNPRDPAATDLRLLLNASYKKGIPVTRYNVDLGAIEEFYPYGPKLLASVSELNAGDTLGSRCIRINMLRTISDKGNLVVSEDCEDFSALRHQLYCFSLLHFRAIRGIYRDDTSITILKNRQMELWRPLLSIAKFLTGQPEGPSDLLDMVKDFAELKVRQDAAAGLTEWDEAMLRALNTLVGTKASDEIKAKAIKDKMLDHLGEDVADEIKLQWIGYAIKRMGLLPDPKRKKHCREGAQYLIVAAEVRDVMTRYGVKNEQ